MLELATRKYKYNKIYKKMSDGDVIVTLVNPNSLDNKGSCWILKDFYFSVNNG